MRPFFDGNLTSKFQFASLGADQSAEVSIRLRGRRPRGEFERRRIPYNQWRRKVGPMAPPPAETIVHLADGQIHPLGDLTVQRLDGVFLVTGPAGLDGQPRTDVVYGVSFSIGQDMFVRPGGEATRTVTVFQAA